LKNTTLAWREAGKADAVAAADALTLAVADVVGVAAGEPEADGEVVADGVAAGEPEADGEVVAGGVAAGVPEADGEVVAGGVAAGEPEADGVDVALGVVVTPLDALADADRVAGVDDADADVVADVVPDADAVLGVADAESDEMDCVVTVGEGEADTDAAVTLELALALSERAVDDADAVRVALPEREGVGEGDPLRVAVMERVGVDEGDGVGEPAVAEADSVAPGVKVDVYVKALADGEALGEPELVPEAERNVALADTVAGVADALPDTVLVAEYEKGIAEKLALPDADAEGVSVPAVADGEGDPLGEPEGDDEGLPDMVADSETKVAEGLPEAEALADAVPEIKVDEALADADGVLEDEDDRNDGDAVAEPLSDAAGDALVEGDPDGEYVSGDEDGEAVGDDEYVCADALALTVAALAVADWLAEEDRKVGVAEADPDAEPEGDTLAAVAEGDPDGVGEPEDDSVGG